MRSLTIAALIFFGTLLAETMLEPKAGLLRKPYSQMSLAEALEAAMNGASTG
jgi:hypothetical protein